MTTVPLGVAGRDIRAGQLVCRSFTGEIIPYPRPDREVIAEIIQAEVEIPQVPPSGRWLGAADAILARFSVRGKMP